jgi:hypothetical protein
MSIVVARQNLAHDELVRNERQYGCCQGLLNRGGVMESPPLTDSRDSYKIKLLHTKVRKNLKTPQMCGVTPEGWTTSSRSFDQLARVVILELNGSPVAKS